MLKEVRMLVVLGRVHTCRCRRQFVMLEDIRRRLVVGRKSSKE